MHLAGSKNLFSMVEIKNMKNNRNNIGRRVRNFHLRYLELCRAKNYIPAREIKGSRDEANLEFFGDKLRMEDWLLINESLSCDTALQLIRIRWKRKIQKIAENIDCEKKARVYIGKPIFTKFILAGLVDALAKCIVNTKQLIRLELEGFPLTEEYTFRIAKALSKNKTIQYLSFSRCSIGDEGCKVLCSAVRHLCNIEALNLTECCLTSKGARSISELIKYQKIDRYSEGWIKSLRYREVDLDSLPGLRAIYISRNEIQDKGLSYILEVLKEDDCIKVLEVQECGISDLGASFILQCLKLNTGLQTLNVKKNRGISDGLKQSIRQEIQCQIDDEEIIKQPIPNNSANLMQKISLLEQKLEFELNERKCVEELNDKLRFQLIAYEEQMKDIQNHKIPEGFLLVSKECLNQLSIERDDLQDTISAARLANFATKGKKYTKLRKAQSQINALKAKQLVKSSKSERIIEISGRKEKAAKKLFVERDIGDSCANRTSGCNKTNRFDIEKLNMDAASFSGEPALKGFSRNKTPPNDDLSSIYEQYIGDNFNSRYRTDQIEPYIDTNGYTGNNMKVFIRKKEKTKALNQDPSAKVTLLSCEPRFI